jgi:hypothetical protein
MEGIHCFTGVNRAEMNTGSLDKGTYLVRIESKTGIETLKLILQ